MILFGYTEETPSQRNLLVRMIVGDLAQHPKGNVPAAFQNLVPPSGRQSERDRTGHVRDIDHDIVDFAEHHVPPSRDDSTCGVAWLRYS
jgi:hypothetical protein